MPPGAPYVCAYELAYATKKGHAQGVPLNTFSTRVVLGPIVRMSLWDYGRDNERSALESSCPLSLGWFWPVSIRRLDVPGEGLKRDQALSTCPGSS